MTVLELKELLHDYPDNYIIGFRDQENGRFIEIDVVRITSEDMFDLIVLHRFLCDIFKENKNG